MPKILIVGKFVFLLFASDVSENRRHIHVEVRRGRKRRVAKFWLEPRIELVAAGGLTTREVTQVIALLEENAFQISRQLDRFYSGKPVKVVKK